jgi:tRNA pseudouridine32 synthase/23S rRNA pseudouridine746 synthase
MLHPEISVIYADSALLVLNKPSGLLCVPGRGPDKQDCLSSRVSEIYPDARIVHRLDMATSGLLLMARGPLYQKMLSQAFAERTIRKRYIAVVDGLLPTQAEEWSVIDMPIALDWPNRPLRIIDANNGKPSCTRWRVLRHDAGNQTTRLELEPITGRSHQLRVHLQALRHPILGDVWYGSSGAQAKAKRLLLHASRLELIHPANSQPITFASEPEF